MKKNNSLLNFSASLIILSALVAACAASTSTPSSSDGDGSGGSGTATPTPTPTPTPKALVNSWENSNGGQYVLDLSAGNTSGTPFTATLSYQGSVCTMTMELTSTNDSVGNCIITATPSHSGGSSGISSTDCTENNLNICGAGGNSTYPQTGKYNWDGTNLTFENNNSDYQ